MTDPRLLAAAALVRQHSRVADIGTDHAHLPVYLIESGKCERAIAGDLREGPVAAARRSVEKAGLADRIDLRLGDGLSILSPDEADDIVIAGMGGETIVSILDAAPFIRDARYRLILQPMTRAEILRRYLWEQGFSIETECPVVDGRHIYTVICAAYTGNAFTPTAAECVMGKMPLPQGAAYIQKEMRRLQRQAQATKDDTVGACFEQVRRQYEEGMQ